MTALLSEEVIDACAEAAWPKGEWVGVQYLQFARMIERAAILALAERLNDVDGDPLSNAERAQAAAALREAHAKLTNCQNKLKASGRYKLREENERLRAQLPDGMKDCAIRFLECEKGHGRLTATNWIEHGCQTCELERLRALLAEARICVTDTEMDGLEPFNLLARIDAELKGKP
jgi:hypothetical protein